MADADNQCDHEACSCTAADNSSYCSPYCESADEGDTTVIQCECGHPGCEAA